MITALNRPLTEVQTLASTPGCPPLMSRYEQGGNEYIFLKGVANTVAGMWVTYDEVGVTTLVVADAFGPVAVAMSACDDTAEGGWYQIFGAASGRLLTLCADNAALYATATAGVLDDTAVAGDLIHGAVNRSLIGGATANGAVQLWYPFMDNNVDDLDT